MKDTNSIQLPVIVDSVRDLKDRSCKLGIVTRELSDDEFILLRNLRGLEYWMTLIPNAVQDIDIPKEPAEVERKSPSRRLRAVIYILFSQLKDKGSIKTDFESYYNQAMESLIQKVKNKLE